MSHFHLDISSLSKRRLLLGCLMQQPAYPEWNIFPPIINFTSFSILTSNPMNLYTFEFWRQNDHNNLDHITIHIVLKTWHFIYPNNFVKLWGFQSIIVKWFDKDDASGILDICEISRLNCYILFKVKESLRSFWAGANFLSFNASSFPIVLPLLNKGCHTAMMLIPY